jgi:hypothetical protein
MRDTRESLEKLETLTALLRASSGALFGLERAIRGEIGQIAYGFLHAHAEARARFEKLTTLLGLGSVVPPPTITAVSLNLGDTAGGILLRIHGTFLRTTLMVTLGGTPLTDLVIVSDSEVRARTPAKAPAIYDIAITTAGGTDTFANAYESWNPIQLPGGPDIYDSDLGITSAGAPATVSAWVDQGAAPFNVSQPTAGNRPLYEAGQFRGGLQHALSSNGTTNLTSRFIENQVAAKLQPNGRSHFAVMKTLDTRTGFIQQNPSMCIVGQSDGNEWVEGLGLVNGDLQYVGFNGATFDRLTAVAPAKVNDGRPHVVGLTNNQATGDVKFYVDGTLIDTQNTAYSAFYGFRTFMDGFTAPSNQCFAGKLGCIVSVDNVMSGPNIAKLETWFFGKFVQEEFSFTLTADLAPWAPRDGAAMLPLNGKLYIVGGWDPANPAWAPTGTTNEVWESADAGATWVQILARDANPPTSGPGARFRPRHIYPGIVHRASDGFEYIYVIGGDQTDPDFPDFPSDVWRTKDGLIWERVAASSLWGSIGPGGVAITGRMQHMCWSFNGSIYLAGGQSSLSDETTAMNDYWRSDDDGATWAQIGTAPWAGRGSVTGNTVMGGFMWMVGGGAFSTVAINTITYREVWKFDGVTWTLVTNAPPWLGRIYNFCQVANDSDDVPTLYLIGGANGVGTNYGDIWASRDGITWIEKTMNPRAASHADGIALLNGNIIMGPGIGGIILADSQVWTAALILAA